MQTTGLLLLVLHLLYFHVLGELVGIDDSRVSLDIHQHKRGSHTSERGKRITGYVRLIATHRLLVEDKRPGRSLWAIDREEAKQRETVVQLDLSVQCPLVSLSHMYNAMVRQLQLPFCN